MTTSLYLNLCEEEDIVVSEQDLVHPVGQLVCESLVGLEPAGIEAQAQRGPALNRRDQALFEKAFLQKRQCQKVILSITNMFSIDLKENVD